jgi:hypothetical protein
MSIVDKIKLLHVQQFRDGQIKQATFLKSFKKEILELQSMGYKPSEIKDYLEHKLDVRIKMNSFHAWLHYAKNKDPGSKNGRTKEITDIRGESVSSKIDTVRLESTLDILSSTDFD